MSVKYYSIYDSENVNGHNCEEITGFDIPTLISFTGVQGYTNEFNYTISGKYPMVRIKVVHKEYELQRTIHFDESRVKNEYFDVKNKGEGIGRKIFVAQVGSLTKHGFQKINVLALGGESCEEWNGHITWAKFGFTMDSGSEIKRFRKLMSDNKRHELTLNELLQSAEGYAIWEQNGFSWSGVFLLSEHSKNRRILEGYLKLYN